VIIFDACITVHVSARAGRVPATDTAELDENGNPVELIVAAIDQQAASPFIVSSESHGL